MVFNAKKTPLEAQEISPLIRQNQQSFWNTVCFASKHFVSCIIQISSPPVSSLLPREGLILFDTLNNYGTF